MASWWSTSFPAAAPATNGNACYFSNMRLKQHSYVSAQQQFSTSGAFVLRYLYKWTLRSLKKMRKQVIAVATAIVLGIATTATGTPALARGGGGGGGGHGGGFGGGGHGFGGGGFGGHGFAMGHGGFGHSRFGHSGFDHGRFEGRRFGRGLYAYGGDYEYGYCNPYYYPYGCYGY
jgi:hypothetical protein